MEQQFELIAKTFMGLEPVLAKELTQLGANDVQIGRRMVSFTGDKELMYRANFQLHTAIKILKPIHRFTAHSADDVYNEIMKLDWTTYLDGDRTFAVDSVVFSEDFRHSKFVSYKVKDAIVDQLRERTGKRPNISVTSPDLRLHIHIAEDQCTLCLDSSGESLHRRGYRQSQTEAPINEVLAAGIIMMTGWQGETDFIDPFCGSGTFLVEAALIARNMAPGLFRKEYAFEKWSDFDAELFDNIYNDESQEREFKHHIYGYDIDVKAVNTALQNVKAAGLSDCISVDVQDFKDFTQPQEKSIIVTNPPYGERISTPDLLGTYRMIGERLKHQFTGGDAWIISYREECFEQIGLKPSIKIPLYNGSLECGLRRYQLFDGKMRQFRSEGGEVKTDEEKRQMAQAHRFKKERESFNKRSEGDEYHQRLSEQEENEDGDIRSFTFHRHDVMKERKPMKAAKGSEWRDKGERKGSSEWRDKGERKAFKGSKSDRKSDEGNRGGHEHFDRSGRDRYKRDDRNNSRGKRGDDKRGGYDKKRSNNHQRPYRHEDE